MNPLTLKASNYGPYQSVEFDIPAGLTAVVGVNTVGEGADSNGSGKTKLLELLPIALFGPPAPWSEYLTVGAAETLCTVELTFEHNGESYQVRRTFDAKGRGKTTLDLERFVEGEFEPLTLDSQSATQAALVKLIGLGEQSFAHSVFAAQGARHFADPALPPRERKAILAEALGLDVWDELAKLVKIDIQAAEKQAEALSARLGAFEEDLAQKDALEEAHTGLVGTAQLTGLDVIAAETSEAVARREHEDLRAAAERRNHLERAATAADIALKDLQAQQKAADIATQRAAEIRATLPETEELAAAAEELEAEGQQLAIAVATRTQAIGAKATLETQAQQALIRREKAKRAEATLHEQALHFVQQRDEISAGEAHCDRCKQLLTGPALTAAIDSVDQEITKLREQAEQYSAEALKAADEADQANVQAAAIVVPDIYGEAVLEGKREKLRSARAAVADLAAMRERLEGMDALVAGVQTAEFKELLISRESAVSDADIALQALGEATPFTVRDSDAADSALAAATLTLTEARTRDQQAQTALATSAERLRNLAALASRSQDALAERAQLHARLETLTALARSYGRDGIPALILEATAIPQLESEANRVLDQLGARFRFELVTQRENKGGGLKDTLDVMVHGEQGSLRYESYSGGEQTRLAFALRIALARLIAGRQSAHAGILVLDELPYLDASGIAAVCEVLRGLGEFRSILLVSHDDRFVDAFDNVVTVIRDEQGSRLETSA